jgi:aldose 1-epimerase
VTYNNSFELKFEFNAVTDRPTLVNLTMHPYFNLAGTVPSRDEGPATQREGSLPEITDHRIQILSQEITAIDASLVPTGQRMSVAGTPFDLRTPTPIGAVVDQPHDQIVKGRGLDHNFILSPSTARGTALARVDLPTHGRALELWTDQPGLQCYTGNWLDGSIRGKAGMIYGRRSGFCLEPQKFPDAPHHPTFPSIMLRPGEEYRHTSIYRLVL